MFSTSYLKLNADPFLTKAQKKLQNTGYDNKIKTKIQLVNLNYV